MSVSRVLFTNETSHFSICVLAVYVSAPDKCFKIFVFFSNFMCLFSLIGRNFLIFVVLISVSCSVMSDSLQTHEV